MYLQLLAEAADAVPWIFGGIGLGILALIVLTSIFWIWMLIDSIINPALDSTERLIWALVIFFTHLIGALIYFLVAKGKGGRGTPVAGGV